MKPTDEQVTEFWAGHGFTKEPVIYKPVMSTEPEPPDFVTMEWAYPDRTHHAELPPTDLNNLFRYAAPETIVEIMKQQECSKELARQILFKKWLQKIEDGLPEEDALFWSIREVTNG